jgi:hypothetical protein
MRTYKLLCSILFTGSIVFVVTAAETALLTFDQPQDEVQWKTVNDNVMGGRSEGGFNFNPENGTLVFSGSTNTDGGGFSSIRTVSKEWNLGDTDGIEIRVKGDGRTYMADLRKQGDRRWIPVAYRAEFETVSGEWQTVRIPFSEFKPTRMGQNVTAPAITPAEVGALGFMIYDKKDGPFKLEVDRVGVYSDPTVAPGDMGPLPE